MSHHAHQPALKQSSDDLGIRPSLLVHIANDGPEHLVPPLTAQVAHHELIVGKGRDGRPVVAGMVGFVRARRRCCR